VSGHDKHYKTPITDFQINLSDMQARKKMELFSDNLLAALWTAHPKILKRLTGGIKPCREE
jgi:hypothetical protein